MLITEMEATGGTTKTRNIYRAVYCCDPGIKRYVIFLFCLQLIMNNTVIQFIFSKPDTWQLLETEKW